MSLLPRATLHSDSEQQQTFKAMFSSSPTVQYLQHNKAVIFSWMIDKACMFGVIHLATSYKTIWLGVHFSCTDTIDVNTWLDDNTVCLEHLVLSSGRMTMKMEKVSSGWVITIPLCFGFSFIWTFRLTCTGIHVLTDLSRLSSYGCPVPVVIFQLSCPSNHPVFMSCSGHPVLSVLSRLICQSDLSQAVLS